MPEKATVPAMITKTPRTGGGSRVAGGDERNELALEVAASAVEPALLGWTAASSNRGR